MPSVIVVNYYYYISVSASLIRVVGVATVWSQTVLGLSMSELHYEYTKNVARKLHVRA